MWHKSAFNPTHEFPTHWKSVDSSKMYIKSHTEITDCTVFNEELVEEIDTEHGTIDEGD